MKMKIKANILACSMAAMAALSLGSCSDFLDEQPKTSLTEETMYSDPEYAESNIQTCYKGWR